MHRKNPREHHCDVSQCINCGQCTKHCSFLTKYDIDISDTEKLEKLAYHCFLCGKCTEVCPMGIDGREIILRMRQKQVQEQGGKLKDKAYLGIVLEKGNYIFKNYRSAKKSNKAVFFPGCNFLGYYPKTCAYISQKLQEQGISTVYDCCGKPIAELGLQNKEAKNIQNIENTLAKQGVQELIVACPNCYDFLKPKLRLKVRSIYDVLQEFGWGNPIEEAITIFAPCSDREKHELYAQIRPFLKQEASFIEQVQCCGLGGCAGIKERTLANIMSQSMKDIVGDSTLHVYCATCAGKFSAQGIPNVVHVLPQILGIEEVPQIKSAFINRALHLMKA